MMLLLLSGELLGMTMLLEAEVVVVALQEAYIQDSLHEVECTHARGQEERI